MAIRVNPRFIEDLTQFGAADVQMCYHCGDCSAVCVHSDDLYKFPRKSMRQLQMGLEKKMETALEPWLCYYCGQCSDQCPREADPGETMMSLRRWLISRYDITGIADKFFRSKKTEIWTIVIIGLLIGIAVMCYHFFKGSLNIYDGEQAFLPSSLVHNFDISLGAFLGIILIINAGNMWRLTMNTSGNVAIPWWLYLKSILLLPLHFFTQKRYAKCETAVSSKLYMPWLVHLGLMWGYLTMLILVMVFLPYLQSGPEILWPVHIFGYLATLGLMTGVFYFIYSRFAKKYVQYKKSHNTDWVFVVLLLLITISGVFQHIFHRNGFLIAANVTYLLHLMFPFVRKKKYVFASIVLFSKVVKSLTNKCKIYFVINIPKIV